MTREYVGTVERLLPVGRPGDADYMPPRYGIVGYDSSIDRYALRNSFGPFQVVDAGKRVYRVGPGVYQMESREQVVARLSACMFPDEA